MVEASVAATSGSLNKQVLEQQHSYMRRVGNSWIRLPAPTGVDNVVDNADVPEDIQYQNIGAEDFPDEPFEDIDDIFQRFVCFHRLIVDIVCPW